MNDDFIINNENNSTFIKIEPTPFSLHFNDVNNNYEEIGCFFEKDGKLHFRGDVDKSAEIFVEEIVRMVNANLGNHNCKCAE